ncbi:MAG TPA: hypothetical protein ENJ42_00735 [Hellea balneolensis]|uniref:Bacterial Ig domain-containing protein n=1 Tax=Hellea balneolensis TaxID=287478 RepID=A0A7C5LRH9_9PROT|nr:hypothetical protein [Hellea balneolensis]
MLKNRPFLMILTGAGLAFVIWLFVLYLQPNETKQAGPSEEISSNSILEEYAITPASVTGGVQKEGRITITGNAVAGSRLEIMNAEQVIADTTVAENGNWQIDLRGESLQTTTALEFLMVTPDGQRVRSDQTLLVVRHEHDPDIETIIENQPGQPDHALILLTAPGAPSRVLQSPFDGFPAKEGFALEAIDYDNSGGVIFSGVSKAQGRVRIYANGNNVGESRVDRNGRWSLIFGNIMPLGEYLIQAEFIGEDDKTPIKLTLPFERMTPLFEDENNPRIVVQHLEDRIQVGRALFGGGYQYSVVYAASALEE